MLSIALHVHFFLVPPRVIVHVKDGIISDLLVYLEALPDIGLMVLYHALLLIQALRLNYMLNELRMFQKQAFTTAMAYIMLATLFPDWNHITPALVCNTFIIWLFHQMAKLYGNTQGKTIIFNIGLIAGCTVLLYHPTATLLLLCFAALGILRPFRLNEWFILLLGMLTPFYFLFSALYLRNSFADALAYLPQWHLHFQRPANITATAVSLALLALLWLGGMYIWRSNSNRMVIQVRKNWYVVLIGFIVLAPVSFLTYTTAWEAGLLCIVPLAAFASNVFLYPHRAWLPALFFWALAVMIVYNNWAR